MYDTMVSKMDSLAGELWEELEAKTVPLKSLGHKEEKELWGTSVASKLRSQRADGFFHQSDAEI